jgi:hypothetical protein
VYLTFVPSVCHNARLYMPTTPETVNSSLQPLCTALNSLATPTRIIKFEIRTPYATLNRKIHTCATRAFSLEKQLRREGYGGGEDVTVALASDSDFTAIIEHVAAEMGNTGYNSFDMTQNTSVERIEYQFLPCGLSVSDIHQQQWHPAVKKYTNIGSSSLSYDVTLDGINQEFRLEKGQSIISLVYHKLPAPSFPGV